MAGEHEVVQRVPPGRKHLAWKDSIERILDRRREAIPAKVLEKLMRRLNHTAFVVPFS